MNKTMDSLRTSLEYPGRLIALGISAAGDRAVIVYAITGRSPSSQARRLVARDGGVWVEPTDEDVLKKGNVDLLVYPAVLFDAAGVAVSNGKQTGDIRAKLAGGRTPVSVLAEALKRWDYEPDSPIFTPRISGCVAGREAALSLVRRAPSGAALRSYFEVPLEPGKARLISTYMGPNLDPLPCFEGEPREIILEGASPRETAGLIYEALKPERPERDFRVATACIYSALDGPGGLDLHIINRHERT
jgi:IMP cyclohydrolase